MIDVMTNKPMHVTLAGEGASYLELPVSQFEEVRRLLDQNGIHYWPGENHLSFNGAPPTTLIHISHRSGPDAVQALLDSVP